MTNRPPYVTQVSQVTHKYSTTTALDHVTLQVPAGSTVGFIGPDGVGKSTLLGLLAGVRIIQSGYVGVLGGDMKDKHHRHDICPRIAYMPQGLGQNLYPTLSVFENVDFFGRLFGQSKEERKWRIAELLSSTALISFSDRPAGKLSGGMKQKLGLCCSLIHDPDLLILDEPTTGVDPLSRRQFWELIDRVRSRRDGMSILVATAYMEEAERFDWLVAMNSGRVLATGSPKELKIQTKASTLEETFINLLPDDQRRKHQVLVIPPRQFQGSQPAIEARGLTRHFGAFIAVDHVSFRIERGEIFGFLGSNGCGKTTTMKMLTGLLPASEGTAELFGQPVDTKDMKTRMRVGFMSQSFSLYNELTVRQNLELHARLFHLPKAQIYERVNEMIDRFGLTCFVNDLSERLPLGIRQRLSLAVAVIHRPEMLILDEPTSGVDPVARDQFWELLIDLSRKEGVTIFISTHFMNEAERCDRISLMHASKVLAQDVPQILVNMRNVRNLEEAFIAYLEDATGQSSTAAENDRVHQSHTHLPQSHHGERRSFAVRRAWAYTRREGTEISRDPIRLAFALLGPVLLMMVFGYGISFDVENLPYAVLDHDHTPEGRTYLENYTGSRYFHEQQPPIRDYADLDKRLKSGELKLAIEIPPGFGKDLKRGNQPEVGVWLDGAMPFRAETTRGYVEGIHQFYLRDLGLREFGHAPQALPINIEIRFRYNQDFKSVFAMVPGSIMLLLVLIPAMMTAVGVVREKEMGSITNLYATPVTRLEFLIGKQIPYAMIALVNFTSLVLLSLFVFQVSVKGSFPALAVGTLLYVIATTGLGLLISTFMKTQMAAIFGTAIMTVLPAIEFSGFMGPISSLSGGAWVVGHIFPSAYFQQISLGTFTKSLGFADLFVNYLALTGFIIVFLILGCAFLKTQET